MFPEREQRAWAAGFLDGEGCFGQFKSGELRFGMGQSDRDVLDRFRSIVGVGEVRGPYTNKGSSMVDGYVRKSMFHYQASSFEDVQWIAILLWRWMSKQKKEKFKTATRHRQNGTMMQKRRYTRKAA